MDIVLDSNIFRSDILLRSKYFDVLLDYLKKTDSHLILPQIVLDEIKGLYIKVLEERMADLNNAIKNINLTLTEFTSHVTPTTFDTSLEVSKYLEYVKTKLSIDTKSIIPYNNNFLPIIANRAIDRIKPSGDDGQGFRDTLIWLTIKEYCKKRHDYQLTFISNNTNDFANSDKSTLHDSLASECKEMNIRVNYFKSLKEFIETHSVKIDFINIEWVDEHMDFKELSGMIDDYSEGRRSHSLVSWFESKYGNACTGFRILSSEPSGTKDLYVYEMSDERLIINVTVVATLNIEFAYSYFAFYHEEYGMYEDNTLEDYFECEVYVAITVVGKKITDVEISDIDI